MNSFSVQPSVDQAAMVSGRAEVLEVTGLTTCFRRPGAVVRAVEEVSFSLGVGEALAIVGESGSGKSVSMLSLMRLLDGPAVDIAGAAAFRDRNGVVRNLLKSDERTLNSLRGSDLAMIFQDASASLNPLFSVGAQIAETVRLHGNKGRKAAWDEAVALLERVGIAVPEQRARDYPHQLSGGMRQRVMIAIALAGQPRLLIADEPTTALDVTIQAQILNLLEDLQHKEHLSIILVTHDLGVVADFADRVLVMYAGQVVEEGVASSVLGAPRHPYTAALLACLPGQAGGGPSRFRRSKPGLVPVIDEDFRGCRFRSRCQLARPACASDIPLIETGPGWKSRCLFWQEAS